MKEFRIFLPKNLPMSAKISKFDLLPHRWGPLRKYVRIVQPICNSNKDFFSFVLTHCLFDNTVAAYASIAPPIFSKKTQYFYTAMRKNPF